MEGCLICYRRLDTVWKFGCRASSWTDVLECVDYSHHKLRKACSWRYSMRSTWIGWCKFSQMAVQPNQGVQSLPRISPVILESNPNQLFHQKFLGTFVSWCVFVFNIIALESSESKITLFKPMAHIFLWILVFGGSHKIVVHIDSTQTQTWYLVDLKNQALYNWGLGLHWALSLPYVTCCHLWTGTM